MTETRDAGAVRAADPATILAGLASEIAAIDAFNAIEELQSTALWAQLPLETRRVLCAARHHLDALTDTLAEVV